MSTQRTKRIIGVFGGGKAGKREDALALAESLGRAVADAGEILLSGGKEPAEKPISQRAIRGAVRAPRPGAWLGVARMREEETGVPTFEERPDTNGAVLTSDLGHVRNYLEALMCDGAIAVAGGDGTRFEVASALSLRRPVAVIGWDWRRLQEHPLAADATEWLLRGSRRRFDTERSNHSLDDRVKKCLLQSAFPHESRYRYFELPSEDVSREELAHDVVEWVVRQLPDRTRFAGTFPVGVHDRLAEWLMKHGASSSSPSDI